MARKTGSKGEETAREIRQAALSAFARQGYAAVSMRQIAAEIGLQAGALYNHFVTKQDILRDLMVGHMEELIEAWHEAAPDSVTPIAALEAFIRFHIRYHASRADDVFVSYMELRNLEPENFREVEALRQRYEACLRDILAAGRRSGEFEITDVPVAAMAIIAMLTGVTTWYRSSGRLSIGEVEEIYVAMALGSVGAGKRALQGQKREEACSRQA
ncbi:MAG: TetR family transcriptional regulator [Salaquimonas sp.]|jgi:AcrR family transcriptional regulator|nr:TetR family transcriptional regulator [Salaquimonas sp.]